MVIQRCNSPLIYFLIVFVGSYGSSSYHGVEFVLQQLLLLIRLGRKTVKLPALPISFLLPMQLSDEYQFIIGRMAVFM